MKTEVNIPETALEKPKFPALYKSHLNGDIVLFTDYKDGTLIAKGKPYKSPHIGYRHAIWTSCDDTETWQRLPAGTTATITRK